MAWFTPEHCGFITPGGESFSQLSPEIGNTDAMLTFVGRTVKYYPRMTREARCALGAAHLALRAVGWRADSSREVGLIAAGYEGCLEADKNYFRDYLSAGRSMGRGNLFIYTLPTSTLGEVAIALRLTGPSLHIHDGIRPIGALLDHARRLIDDREAAGILCLWSDSNAAVCFAADGASPVATDIEETTPLQLADAFRQRAGSRKRT